MTPTKVLFICQHNSARSQMAEAFLNQLGQGRFTAQSAGLEPTEINPLVVEVMQEEGLDLSANNVTDVFALFRSGELFQYVITVCSQEVEKKCPMFPGLTDRLNWPFPDPAKATGTHEEKMAATRAVRDDIRARIVRFIDALS
jgi:arsenate reductase